MKNWCFGAASIRGTSHIKAGTRLQDAKRCFSVQDSGLLFAVVSDGAGSASHGGEGASIVCRSMSEFVRQHIAENGASLPTEDLVWDWLDETRDRIFAASASRSLTPRDFAATLVMVVTDGQHTLTAHIGDGAIVGKFSENSAWSVLGAPENGEYANVTFFVSDSGSPRMRIKLFNLELESVFVFSDSIEHLVLDAATGQPHEGFFTPMVKPFAASDKIGRDRHLSERLAAYLNSPQMAEHTDDDKTLVVAVRK